MVRNYRGFSLVELIIVIAIISILATIALPRMWDFREHTKERVCSTNCETVERMYTAFITGNDLSHTEDKFSQFLSDNYEEICPAGGVISYSEGKVSCSIHRNEEESQEEELPGDEVPWL